MTPTEVEALYEERRQEFLVQCRPGDGLGRSIGFLVPPWK